MELQRGEWSSGGGKGAPEGGRNGEWSSRRGNGVPEGRMELQRGEWSSTGDNGAPEGENYWDVTDVTGTSPNRYWNVT